MKNNIALIGFMGSGKTTAGRLLADRIGYLFLDLDELIEISEQRKINDIFRESGEDHFRDIELKTIKKIAYNKACVFACGGGVVLRGENMKIISKNSYVVYLMVSPLEAVKRLFRSMDRPLLPDKKRNERIHELIDAREKLYSGYADIIINNEKISPEDTIERIIASVQ
ncbi:MAG: shikimate kinase [Actinomycetia bacterium]|nr:shikimate kinase [Actinomycetes bacterium]